MMITKVFLVEDHTLVREGLRGLIEKESDLEVVGEACHGREVVSLIQRQKTDVVIMDVTMPYLNGIEATRQISADCPGVKVLALSIHAERVYVVEMLRAGASGYLVKNCKPIEFITAIRTVATGQTYLSPGIAGLIVDEFVRKASNESDSLFTILTPREREVLQLLAEGNSTKEIAFLFNVSVSTVETHIQQLRKKSNAQSIAELTKMAIRFGLTSIEF